MIKIKRFWENLSVRKPLRNRKGFTLIELVITMGLIGILLMAGTNIFMTAGNAFANAHIRSQQQLLLDGMMEVVSSELRYATDVDIVETNSGIFSDGEGLHISTISSDAVLYGEGYDLTLEFAREDDYTLLVEITLDNGLGVYTTESAAIRLINCEISKNALEATPENGISVKYISETI